MLLARDESLSVNVPFPPAAHVPAGFVYVPPGRFLFGSAGDEDLRRTFFGARPVGPHAPLACPPGARHDDQRTIRGRPENGTE
jgi:hypothetical protein